MQAFAFLILGVLMLVIFGVPYAETFLHPDDRDSSFQPQHPAATENTKAASAEVIHLKRAA